MSGAPIFRIGLTDREYAALIEAVAYQETNLEEAEDEPGLADLNSAWKKVQAARVKAVTVRKEEPRRYTDADYRKRMRCPDCGKKGVTYRQGESDDYYGCRYCDFECYSHSREPYDVKRQQALAAVNPDHPLAPSKET